MEEPLSYKEECAFTKGLIDAHVIPLFVSCGDDKNQRLHMEMLLSWVGYLKVLESDYDADTCDCDTDEDDDECTCSLFTDTVKSSDVEQILQVWRDDPTQSASLFTRSHIQQFLLTEAALYTISP